MSIRDKPLYISTETWRCLWLLSKAEAFEGDPSRSSTPDEIADIMLRQAIREGHPELPTHLNEINKLEKELIKKLRKGTK